MRGGARTLGVFGWDLNAPIWAAPVRGRKRAPSSSSRSPFSPMLRLGGKSFSRSVQTKSCVPFSWLKGFHRARFNPFRVAITISNANPGWRCGCRRFAYPGLWDGTPSASSRAGSRTGLIRRPHEGKRWTLTPYVWRPVAIDGHPFPGFRASVIRFAEFPFEIEPRRLLNCVHVRVWAKAHCRVRPFPPRSACPADVPGASRVRPVPPICGASLRLPPALVGSAAGHVGCLHRCAGDPRGRESVVSGQDDEKPPLVRGFVWKNRKLLTNGEKLGGGDWHATLLGGPISCSPAQLLTCSPAPLLTTSPAQSFHQGVHVEEPEAVDQCVEPRNSLPRPRRWCSYHAAASPNSWRASRLKIIRRFILPAAAYALGLDFFPGHNVVGMGLILCQAAFKLAATGFGQVAPAGVGGHNAVPDFVHQVQSPINAEVANAQIIHRGTHGKPLSGEAPARPSLTDRIHYRRRRIDDGSRF